MTQKEKAKAYDEAIERAEKSLEVLGTDKCEGARQIFSLFPELAESADERIRKAIYDALRYLETELSWDFLSNVDILDAYAWLEKQGEQNVPSREMVLNVWELGNIWKEITKGVCNTEHGTQLEFIIKHWNEGEHYTEWLEKQGERKPVNDTDEDIVEAVKDTSILDLVEPKFHEGDWIVWQNKCYKVNYNGCCYELIDQDGLSTSLEYGTVDENAHLFTIQDAKDGDVLVSRYNKPFIYNGNRDSFHIGSYCGISVEDGFKVATEKCHWTENVNIHPAAKEQRDTLFAKMKKAGYEWDADKKELKEIKIITPLFNVGDTIIKKNNSDINKFGQFTITDITDGKYWYNDRIICDISEQYEWELVEQKPISFDTSTPVSYDDIPFGEKDYELHEATYFIPEGFHAEIERDKVIIKRGEQKSEELPNGEDYGIDGLYHAISILERTYGKVDGYQSDDGILEHECAISAVKKLYKKKPAWSEEDDEILRTIISDGIRGAEFDMLQINWLKSLKQRIGG